MSIARNIEMVIAEKGLLKKCVAKKAGFSENSFSDMLHGRKIIKADYIPRIANALDVEPNDLFRGRG